MSKYAFPPPAVPPRASIEMNEYDVGELLAVPIDGWNVQLYGAAVPVIVGANAMPSQTDISSMDTAGTDTDNSGSLAVSVAMVAMIGLRRATLRSSPTSQVLPIVMRPVGSTKNFLPPDANEGDVPAVPSAFPTSALNRMFPDEAAGTVVLLRYADAEIGSTPMISIVAVTDMNDASAYSFPPSIVVDVTDAWATPSVEFRSTAVISASRIHARQTDSPAKLRAYSTCGKYNTAETVNDVVRLAAPYETESLPGYNTTAGVAPNDSGG